MNLEDLHSHLRERDAIIRIVVAPDVLEALSERVPALPFRVGGSSTWIAPSGVPVVSSETLPPGAWEVVRRRDGEECVAETGSVRLPPAPGTK